MSHNGREIPLQSDIFRMRRHVDNLNLESDYDSEYANHPPPTDSEIEIEINPAFSQSRRFLDINNNNGNNGSRIMNRSSNNSVQSTSSSSHNNSNLNLINENNNMSRNILLASTSTAVEDLYNQRKRLKNYGLKRLNIKQHIIVTICRDIPIYSMLKNFIVLITQWYKLMKIPYNNLTTVRATEFFLASIWCLVSALLSYTILDGLMVRWMLIYAIQAVIVRILSMSLIIVMVVEMFNYTFNNSDNEFCLTVWIFISCVLTLFFIIQCCLSNNLNMEEHLKSKDHSSSEIGRSRTNTTNASANNNNNNNNKGNNLIDDNRSKNNLNENNNNNNNNNDDNDNNNSKSYHSRSNSGITENENKFLGKYKRKIDLYNLIVFAVVPIGVASFVSMVGLVRLLVILRLDIGIEMTRIQQNS